MSAGLYAYYVFLPVINTMNVVKGNPPVMNVLCEPVFPTASSTRLLAVVHAQLWEGITVPYIFPPLVAIVPGRTQNKMIALAITLTRWRWANDLLLPYRVFFR